MCVAPLRRNLEFVPGARDPWEHRYTVGGIAKPSVTTIIKGAGLSGSAFYTKEARDRGTLVHALTANRDGNRALVQVDDTHEALNAVAGFVLAYADFCATYRPAWRFIEQPIFDPELNVAGTFDRAGTLQAINLEILLDIKTGPPAEWHPIQTAAYNLPNDEKVTREKGSKRVMLKNVQEAKFQKILMPIAGVAVDKSQQPLIAFEQFFTAILAHELMHGLGPKNTGAGGGGPNSNAPMSVPSPPGALGMLGSSTVRRPPRWSVSRPKL